MRNVIKNNRGSTLILLVMSIAIISLLGTSILGVTMMNLKIKKTNTNIKQSFYLSESGLDIAYDNVNDLVSESINKSNKVAQEFLQEFTTDRLETLIANNDITYLKSSNNDGIFDSYDNEKINDEAKIIFESNFHTCIEDNIVKKIADSSYYNADADEKLDVKVINDTPRFIGSGTEAKMNIMIESEFKSKDNITKNTSVEFNIKTPEYLEVYTISTEIINVNPFWTKTITADNLNIQGTNNVVFDGAVFVNKNLNLKDKGNVDFNQDLTVKRNIEFMYDDGKTKNAKVLNTKNIYAENILLNEEGSKLFAKCESDATVNYPGVLIYDDLEMNSENQEVNIDGSYFGFGTGGNKTNELNSAIIINSNDISTVGGSALNISNDLYLLGTSYITGHNYATGESLSVKGNYIAYSMPLTDGENEKGISLKSDNVIFGPYEPLPPLVEKFKNDELLFPFDKSYYFNEYDKERTEDNEYSGLDKGVNISVDGIIESYGASLNKGNIIPTRYAPENWDQLNSNMHLDYNLKVNHLGDSTVDTTSDPKREKELTFAKEVDTSNSIYDVYKGGSEYKIDELGYEIKDGDYSGLIVTNNDIEISGNDVTFNGLIVTSGNIKISGKFDLKGSIICGGDITLDGSQNKTFTYDKSILLKLISENNTVFKSETSKNKNYITKYTDSNGSTLNKDDILILSNWKIN